MKSSEESLYNFNLHGTLIVDQFDALTCLPVKGLSAPFKLIIPTDDFFQLEKCQNEYGRYIRNILLDENLLKGRM
jgi:uncharacterized linocin/CFP29 family protein